MAKTGWGGAFEFVGAIASMPYAAAKATVKKVSGEADFSDSFSEVIDGAGEACGGFGDRHHDTISDGALKAIGATVVGVATMVGGKAAEEAVKRTLK